MSDISLAPCTESSGTDVTCIECGWAAHYGWRPDAVAAGSAHVCPERLSPDLPTTEGVNE